MKNTATLEMPTGTDYEAELSIPLDLSQWLPCSQLGEWIKEDVGALNWNNPELVTALRRQPEFEPRAFLQTLTLGYATGVFGAEEIERHCSTNPDFRALRPKFAPEPTELRWEDWYRETAHNIEALARTNPRLSATLKAQLLNLFKAREQVIDNAVRSQELGTPPSRPGAPTRRPVPVQ